MKLPSLPPGDYSRPVKSHREVAIPFWDAPAGYCRWCGEDIGARTRSGEIKQSVRWHPACADEWAAQQPQRQRSDTWERALGECAECGRFCPKQLTRRAEKPGCDDGRLRFKTFEKVHYYREWAADHVTPLSTGGENDASNLQLLCNPCHTEKTAAEAGVRRGIHIPDREWNLLLAAALRTRMSVPDLLAVVIRAVVPREADAVKDAA